MRKSIILLTVSTVMLLAGSASAQWTEDFDSYPTGGLHGTGGWEGWNGDSTADAFVVDSISVSAPNAVAVVDITDITQQFTETEGAWTLTAQQYIPSGGTGQTFFILLNTYNPGGGGNSWSTSIQFDLDAGTFAIQEGSAVSVFMTDQWVELQIDFDLDNNTQTVYYNEQLVETLPWQSGGADEFGAIDLFGNGASTVFYDDLELGPNVSFNQSTWGNIKTIF